MRTLADSPNPNISAAANTLIVERFLHQDSKSMQILLKEANSHDERTRTKARQALAFVTGSSDSPESDAAAVFLRQSRGLLDRESDGSRTPYEHEIGWGELSRRLTDGMGMMDDGDGWADPSGGVVPSVRDPVAGWVNVPRERPADADEVEQRRRRNREAMVLHEGDGGVVEEDIIRPRTD